jgi:hypothetical protein
MQRTGVEAIFKFASRRAPAADRHHVMSQEPLDYQTPRSRDNSAVTCPHCGGTRVVDGKLIGGPGVRFLPKRIKSFWTLNNGAKTLTYACLSCGFITILVDPDDLRRLIGPGDSGGSAAT